MYLPIKPTNNQRVARARQGGASLGGASLVCVYVDNAAQSVIKKALQRLLLDDKSFVIILVRDPSHCLDLGPKDLGTQKWAPTIHRFIADVKEVIVT